MQRARVANVAQRVPGNREDSPGCRPALRSAAATWAQRALRSCRLMLCSCCGAASSAHTMAGLSLSSPAGQLDGFGSSQAS